MAMRPVQALVRWCTNLALREPFTPDEELSGFKSGRPVAPLTTNRGIGVVTDWVFYLFNSVMGATILFSPPAAPWRGDATITFPSGRLHVVSNGASDRDAEAQWSPVFAGGTIGGMTVVVNAQSGNVATVIAIVFSGAGVSLWQVTGINAAGTYALAYISGPTEHAGPVGVSFSVLAGTTATDSVTIDYFTLTTT